MEDYINVHHCKHCKEKIDIFECLTEDQMDFVNNGRYQVKFRAGEIIFKQGTSMSHIVCITSGLAKIYIEGINNRNLILRFIRPTTIIGGPGMFVDYRNHFTAMAVEDTISCFIDAVVFKKVVMENNEFAIELLKWINQHTIKNFTKYIDLTQKHMHGRVAGALLYLANDIYKDSDGRINISRQDLADLTSMSKESAIRILKEFKDENTISIQGNTVIINNLSSLEEVSKKG